MSNSARDIADMDQTTSIDEELIADGGTKIMERGPAELGDEDILIADGGTQVLDRSLVTNTKKPASLPPPVPTKLSALDALAATIPAKIKPIPVAPETMRIEELDADDLDEEQRVNATMPFRRIEVVETPRSASLPTSAYGSLAPSPTRASTQLPTVMIHEAKPTNRPASIAPIAIDIPPRSPADATLKLPPVRVAPPKSNTAVVATIVVSSLALCAAAIIGLVSLGGSSDDATTAARSSTTTTVAAKPREAKQSAIRSAIIETPETTPQKAAPPPGERDANGTPVFSASSLPSAPTDVMPSSASPTPARVASTPAPATRPASSPAARPAKAPAVAPPPAAEPAPAPVAAAPAPRPTTGTIQVPGGLMTVMVDSDYRRVQGGTIVVSCGRHRVNAGRGTQSVDVPCGGSVSMM